MNRLNWKTAAVLAAFVPALAFAQTTTKDVSKKAEAAWDSVKSYTVERKDDAVALGKKLVRDSDRELQELDRKAANASAQAQAEFKSELKDLKAKRAVAAKKLDEMGKSSSAAWDEAKNGFANAYQDLHQSYARAVKKLK